MEVCLTATLAVYLPPGTRGDSAVLDVPPGVTVADVMRLLKVPPELETLTVVNGRDASPEQTLAEGDILSVFPPLAGGR
ncbi:MAG TPA: MoaD/ThiS family protein [Methylomirabilota bacterium]|nr:MoaD/ThiS family protein [Methylomirabilota bacterium]